MVLEELKELVLKPVEKVRTGGKKKSYAELKERLREAGMPTGGKKRKILARLKELDDKEAIRARRQAPGAQPTDPDEASSGLISEVASEVDERFDALYTDPEYRVDPASDQMAVIKGRSNVKQRRQASCHPRMDPLTSS